MDELSFDDNDSDFSGLTQSKRDFEEEKEFGLTEEGCLKCGNSRKKSLPIGIKSTGFFFNNFEINYLTSVKFLFKINTKKKFISFGKQQNQFLQLGRRFT